MSCNKTKKGIMLAIVMLGMASGEALAQTAIKTTFVSGTSDREEESAAMVCDGRLSTKWCVSERKQMPYTVVLDAGEKKTVTTYGLWTGEDTHSYPDRNPLTWRVSGSNDKQSWTTVDEQKFNRTMRDENEQEYRFKVSQPAAYRYYRFEFLRILNGTMLQLSEIKLY